MYRSRKDQSGSSEVVGIFGNAPELKAAVDELLISGFDPVELSLLARKFEDDDALRRLYAMVTKRVESPRTGALLKQLNRGELLLGVRARNVYDASRAAKILSKRFATHVRVRDPQQ